MSRYQAYAEYKDSGIDLLGDIPTSWRIQPLLTVCDFQSGKAHEPYIDDDGEFICVNSRFVSTGGESLKFCNQNFSPAQPNDILMVMSDLPNGRALAKAYFVQEGEKLAVNQRVCILTPHNANPRFLYHLLNRNHLFLMHDDGANQTHLSNALFTKFPALLPPELEQEKIANFLDHETAKIDLLIEKQQGLIALLKEKRQAVISHAVTKGLNPNTPLKDSGVEWLGKVPEHWDVLQIRRILVDMEQGKSPECESRTADIHEWGVLKTGCVNNGIYNSEENKFLPENISPFTQYEVKNGDVLMSRASGSVDLIGSVAYVHETRAKLLLSDKVFRIYLDSSVNKLFFTYLMRSTYMRTNIKNAISGAEGMANNITKGSILAFQFALPTFQEQSAIVDFIDSKLDVFDNLISRAEVATALLQERRTALISAAVTGKIDVRDWQAKH